MLTTMAASSVGDSMDRRMSLASYLDGEETNRPQELAYGVLREPAAPGLHHQVIVGRIHVRIDRHVRRYRFGRVVESPVDVILDRPRALVVQPDLVFVSTARMDICRERIWGAPDLVVEVLSTSGRRHDRTTKIRWYRRYGVAECWIVDPVECVLEVHDLRAATAARKYEGPRMVRSQVLPRLRMRAAEAFSD